MTPFPKEGVPMNQWRLSEQDLRKNLSAQLPVNYGMSTGNHLVLIIHVRAGYFSVISASSSDLFRNYLLNMWV